MTSTKQVAISEPIRTLSASEIDAVSGGLVAAVVVLIGQIQAKAKED